MFHARATETKLQNHPARTKESTGPDPSALQQLLPRRTASAAASDMFGLPPAETAQEHVARLHSTYGNQAVLRMLSGSTPQIQTKLAVNQPGDEFELEADRVADHVMRMTAPPAMQRKCSSCEEEEEKTDKLQRKCAECAGEDEKKVQRKEWNAGPEATPPIVDDVLLSPGHPLDSATRAFMEPRFGHDFSRVRVHTDARAADSAQAVNALAYTVGSDIVFGRQQYAPASPDGQRLLAHELTHVVQQSAALPVPPVAQLLPAASRAVPASSTGGAKPISACQGAALQREVPGAATLTSLGGQALSTSWSKLNPATKAQLIDFVIDAQIQAIPSFPGKEIFGDTWIFLKEGLTGFLTKLKASPTAIKVQAMDNIVPLLAGADQKFSMAYLKGLLKGFFIDGALGIFIAIWDLLKGLKSLWNFLKEIGESTGGFPEFLSAQLERFDKTWAELMESLGPAIDEFRAKLADPKQGSSFLVVIGQKAQEFSKSAGESIADALLNFFAKPEATAEIGETVGDIIGMVLWEVVFAVVTAGGGAAVTAAKGAIKEAVEVLSKIVGKIVSGILKIVEKIRAVFSKVVDFVRGAIKFVAGKLKEAGAKLAELFEGVGDFFKTLLKSCHESKLVCDFAEGLEKFIEKLAKIDKSRSGAMKELAGRIHQLKGELAGQAIAVVEVRVGGKIRYAAATNSGAGWGGAQIRALEKLGIEPIKPVLGEAVHAEANVEAWVNGLKKADKEVQVLRWGISAGEKGAYICVPCRQIAKSLGGFIEEFSALGKTY